MNEASKTLEFPPPPTPSSHPFAWRFPLLTLTHMLQSFRGTAWRLHVHTHQHVQSDMARLPHRCVMISVCLAGALLLLPLCLGVEDDEYNFDYDSTQSPEYDYNSTFDISFFSNASSEELEKFLMGGGTDSGRETSFTETETEKETDGGPHEEQPTEPTIFVMDQASQTPLHNLNRSPGRRRRADGQIT
ncbi:hypothetical protein QQF64_014115 [Cirrhinus molitorella]|uniref:Uncharacterized protein n=1 Tax=Cirrhinus molitorella TaxID=172907 RepID=A0ABR3LT45_9TELE